jgi:hypothetical protein
MTDVDIGIEVSRSVMVTVTDTKFYCTRKCTACVWIKPLACAPLTFVS